MKFKELLRCEALAACAIASISIPALAQTADPATDTAPHHGGRRLLREMARAPGDPTGEVGVPHLHHSQLAVRDAHEVVNDRKATGADRFREPPSSLDMKLNKFKDD